MKLISLIILIFSFSSFSQTFDTSNILSGQAINAQNLKDNLDHLKNNQDKQYMVIGFIQDRTFTNRLTFTNSTTSGIVTTVNLPDIIRTNIPSENISSHYNNGVFTASKKGFYCSSIKLTFPSEGTVGAWNNDETNYPGVNLSTKWGFKSDLGRVRISFVATGANAHNNVIEKAKNRIGSRETYQSSGCAELDVGDTLRYEIYIQDDTNDGNDTTSILETSSTGNNSITIWQVH